MKIGSLRLGRGGDVESAVVRVIDAKATNVMRRNEHEIGAKHHVAPHVAHVGGDAQLARVADHNVVGLVRTSQPTKYDAPVVQFHFNVLVQALA
jgi:hypothetical protein